MVLDGDHCFWSHAHLKGGRVHHILDVNHIGCGDQPMKWLQSSVAGDMRTQRLDPVGSYRGGYGDIFIKVCRSDGDVVKGGHRLDDVQQVVLGAAAVTEPVGQIQQSHRRTVACRP
jgi:hypothetical protein